MSIRVAIHSLYPGPSGVGEKIGYVTLQNHRLGLMLSPEVYGLSPGFHGFHVHEFGFLGSLQKDGEWIAGGQAGQHFDPGATGVHLGPYRPGHKGDLPRLLVDADGVARTPVVAPRLRLSEVKDRALIIHSGGDNYSDYPVANGGGKSRIAGGIITPGCPYCR